MSTTLQNTSKRDALIEIEAAIQVKWEKEKTFESNPNDKPKYLATFPYPYQNGKLHLGHCFTISKAEFAIGYKMMKGYNCLFPFGFHCTGMPIVAASGKLKRELDEMGFDALKDYVLDPKKTKVDLNTDMKKKLQLKQGNAIYQFEILYSMGVDIEEIPKFIDPYYWCTYFPPHGQNDLKLFGAHIDWRRSFITTDANPYYDKFVQWQFNKLKKLDKIKFGERYTIWSQLDNQPCMDHDRSSGEGVGPQEYTGIKLKLITPSPALKPLVSSDDVFFIAATLRPETMYGQTNCFIGVDIEYSAFQMKDSVYICTERSALNMSFQGQTKEKGKLNKLFSIKGKDLIGCELNAPLSHYPSVYMLPLQHVLATKGTGIVTSVPSDSPDDYMMVMDLKKKAEYYHVDPKWVRDPVSIIETPTGNCIAKDACLKFKVKSPNDRDQLDKAKELAYKEGFYQGKLLVGEYKGLSVSEAKPKIRQLLIDQNLAFPYSEPESRIVSRSGDECVVNLCDQWYLDYGEEEWKKTTKDLLAELECYHPETRHLFEATLDWLNQWACARSFGLGTRLPWDKQFLVESLSDSTIYMAYYTISHLFKQYNISADQLNDAVFDSIFGDQPASDLFKPLKQSFEYYYPFDLRVSGKDLVPNHLTFCIYNHSALFPKKYWPKSIRSNGHLLLNSDKMSKSTGNFLTLKDCLLKYGSDATRFTLADAGDLVEDANFQESTANATILRLFTQLEWTKSILIQTDFRETKCLFDDIFIQNVNACIVKCDSSFNSMQFRDALKFGFYELQELRDWYLNCLSLLQIKANPVIIEFVKLQCLVMAPITSHLSEYIWQSLLNNTSSVTHEPFPTAKVDEMMVDVYHYLKQLIHSSRSQEAADTKKNKSAVVEKGQRILHVFYTNEWPEWQLEAIKALKTTYKDNKFDDSEKQVLGKLKLLKNKKVMPFVQLIKVIHIYIGCCY